MKRTSFFLLAFATLLLSCAKEMEQPVQAEQPGQPVSGLKTYTLSVEAGKAETKALSNATGKLIAFWAMSEEVSVYKGEALFGTLKPERSGESTTLSGTITGKIKKDDVLTLKFLSPDYANQGGTLKYISEHCDYAVASVTVQSVEGGNITTDKAVFQNQQAILLLDLGYVNVSSLVLNIANLSIAVTPPTPTSGVHVAVPAISSQPLSLTATAGDKQYTLLKSDVTLEAGKYYSITATLSEATQVHDDAELRAAIKTDGANILVANDIDLSNSTLSIAEGTTVTIDLNGHTLDRKLTSRDWENGGQVITVRSGATLNLSNGTLQGGWGGDSGGINNEGGTANLMNVTITGCTGDDRGGGICNRSGGKLTMTGGSVENSTSNDKGDPSGGGGIFNAEGATATLTGVTITGNEDMGTGGGGICNLGTLTIDGCTIRDNKAQTEGGGVWNKGSATLNMCGDNIITGNTANGLGNNVYLKEGSVITVTGSLAGSSIGIKQQTEGTFTSGYSTFNSGVKPADIFSPDLLGAKAVFLDNEGKEVKLATIPNDLVYYIDRSWNADKKEVKAAVRYLTDKIDFDAIPTSEKQYKLLPSSSAATMNLGTANSTLHEFYVVKGTVKVNELYVKGPNVHIVLCDDSALVLGNSGETYDCHDITVAEGHTVYIHDQGSKDNMGRLYNGSGYHGCIGGEGQDELACGGNIEIHGGNIDLVGYTYDAAIGGRYYEIGDINIYGGDIHAEGGVGAAGIGGGLSSVAFGATSIYGGVVYAKGGGQPQDAALFKWSGGAGIGGGMFCCVGFVDIYGGYVTAVGNEDDSAGIGCGQWVDDVGFDAYVTINGGFVKAYGGDEAAGIGGGDGIVGAFVRINGGEVEAYGGYHGAGIGGGEGADGGPVIIKGGHVLAVGGDSAGIGAGNGGGSHDSLEIANQCMVWFWNPDHSQYESVVAEDRVSMSRSINVRVVPCSHPGYTADTCPYHVH